MCLDYLVGFRSQILTRCYMKSPSFKVLQQRTHLRLVALHDLESCFGHDLQAYNIEATLLASELHINVPLDAAWKLVHDCWEKAVHAAFDKGKLLLHCSSQLLAFVGPAA